MVQHQFRLTFGIANFIMISPTNKLILIIFIKINYDNKIISHIDVMFLIIVL
jgi:hypothetical protein